MDEEKNSQEQMRPKEQRDWHTGGCPWFIFGDDDAANYDLEKMKKFFQRKFGKKHNAHQDI